MQFSMGDSDEDCKIIDDNIINTSVTCTNIPEEFLDRNVAKKYFEKFGKIHSFTLRPKRCSCTVDFETAESAENAMLEGCYYKTDIMLDINYTPNETSKQRPAIDYIDPDVQLELAAMGSTRPNTQHLNKQYEFEIPKKVETKVSGTPKRIPATNRPKPTLEVGQSKQVDVVAKNELESLMKKPAYTSEEKYRVLEARDKLIRLTTSKTTDIKAVVSTKGVCPDMCPEKERLMREATHHVATYELEDNSKNVMHHSFAVKQYARSSADQEFPLAHELRPEPVLQMTMKYLLHKIVDLCDQSDTNLGDWFHFLWDRTRSIRKDISQQELCSLTAVSLVEQCARLHIHCAARLVAEEPQVFDQKINSENLTKCLQSLKYLYHDLHLKNVQCPNEAEFRAYVILLNLNDCQFFWEVKQLPHDILHSPEIRFAIDVYLAVESNNYVKFFKLVRHTTYMNACILLRYFNQVRVNAISVLLKAYVPRGTVTMTISYWCYILALEDYEQTAQFFEYYGMQCDRDGDRIFLDRSNLMYPDLPFSLDRAINVVEHKRICTVGEVIFGGVPLESLEDFEKYEPHESFDENGYLCAESWAAEDQNYLKPPTPKRKAPHTPFHEENNLFKIPQAPLSSQVKSSQSPKPSIFTKISPKLEDSNKKSLFGSKMDDNERSPKSSIGQSSIFGASTKGTQPPLFGNTTSFGSNAYNSIKSNDSVDTISNIFQLPKEIETTNAFAGFPSVNLMGPFNSNKQISNPSVEKSKGLLATIKTHTESPRTTTTDNTTSIFKSFATQAFSSIRKNTTIFGGKTSSSFASVPGIDPIKPTYLQQDNAKKAEESAKRQQDHEKKLRKDLEETEQKRLKIEAELEKERSELKHKLEISAHANKILEEFLGNLINEEVTKYATDEVEKYKRLEKQCEDYLNDLVIDAVQDELENYLIEAIEVINLNIVKKYFCKWRITVRTIIKRREKIEKTPIWLPEKSIAEHAPELHQSHQKVTINMKKRYRLGEPEQLLLPIAKDDSIDVFQVVGPVLLRAGKNYGKTASFLKKFFYWKCVISLPGPKEEQHFTKYDRWFSNLIVRRDEVISKEIFFCEQISTKNQQNIAICIRKLIGTNLINESGKPDAGEAVANANAFLFFLTNSNLNETKNRLDALLQNQVNQNISIGFLLNHQLDNVEQNNELILDELFNGESPQFDYCFLKIANSLKQLTITTLEYIAYNKEKESTLEMQKTTSFLSECLTEQFWTRVAHSADNNPGLFKAVTNANTVIGIFNDAVTQLITICTPNIRFHGSLAVELKRFVPKHRYDIPLNFYYFPDSWQSPRRQKALITMFESLKLQKMKNNCLQSVEELQNVLIAYAKEHISDERRSQRTGYRMIQCLMEHLQNFNDEDDVALIEKLNRFCWIAPIKYLTIELIASHFELENVAACGSAIPEEIIYDRVQLDYYTKMPWWLNTASGALKNVRVSAGSSLNDTINEGEEHLSKRPKLFGGAISAEELEDAMTKAKNVLERLRSNDPRKTFR